MHSRLSCSNSLFRSVLDSCCPPMLTSAKFLVPKPSSHLPPFWTGFLFWLLENAPHFKRKKVLIKYLLVIYSTEVHWMSAHHLLGPEQNRQRSYKPSWNNDESVKVKCYNVGWQFVLWRELWLWSCQKLVSDGGLGAGRGRGEKAPLRRDLNKWDWGERVLVGRLFSDRGQRLQGESLLGCLRRRDDGCGNAPSELDWMPPHHLILSSNFHNHLVNQGHLTPSHQPWQG